eukprot:138736-Prorocentrum_minimum.AAC.5
MPARCVTCFAEGEIKGAGEAGIVADATAAAVAVDVVGTGVILRCGFLGFAGGPPSVGNSLS